jgi:phosphoesterase RecJ-like protein
MTSKKEEGETHDPPTIRTPARLERQLERVARSLQEHETFLVASHKEPDGDAVGSLLGLALLVEQLGNRALRFNSDPIPDTFQFLEGANRVDSSVPDETDVDVVVLLDCSSVDRLGDNFPPLDDLAPDEVIVIDHHKTIDRGTADRYLDDRKAAAVGELIYRLVRQLDADLTKPLAECIYCTLLTDTGSFQYSSTSKTTFRVAGEMLDAGVDPWKMTVEIFESQPRRRVELLGEVLQTLTFSSCERLAFIRIDQSMIHESERIAELTDGFINYGRSIRGVEVSTQLRERPDGQWKVSFRSKDRVDVSKLAAEAGGGGHQNAAACVMEGPPERIRERLEERLEEILDEPSSE